MFGRLSPVVKNLIIINALMWLATMVLPKFASIDLNAYLGLHYFEATKFNISQVITYMFMHSGFEHLFFNMFSLFMFGSLLENAWGSKRFLTYYILTGIGAALAQEITWYFSLRDFSDEVARIAANGLNGPLYLGNKVVSSVPELLKYKDFILNRFITVGASGSVFGLLLAFGMIFPNMRLYIFPLPIPIKAKYFVIFYGLFELFAGIRSVSGLSSDNVAHFAHLGGLVFGLILILIWRRTTNDNNFNQMY